MIHEMGIDTGVDLDRLTDAGFFIQDKIGQALPSKQMQVRAKE